MAQCDHGIRLDRYCPKCEFDWWVEHDPNPRPAPSRVGWLIPLILAAFVVAAVAWRLR